MFRKALKLNFPYSQRAANIYVSKFKSLDALRADLFYQWLKENKIAVEKEYRFNPNRRWRFDYALPKYKVAVEVEGGVWIQGRHSRGKGMIADMEKYNWAALNGWKVLRYTPKDLQNAIEDLRGLI